MHERRSHRRLALLTLMLLSGCAGGGRQDEAEQFVQSGQLADGRPWERLSHRVAEGRLQVIEVIRQPDRGTIISVGMAQAGRRPGEEELVFERPEPCRIRSRLEPLASGGRWRREVLTSSCSWLPAGSRIVQGASPAQMRPLSQPASG